MTKPGKIRLDKLLAERGLAPSREAAQRLILAGAVRIANDERRQTAGLLMAPEAAVTVIAPERFVSRGGLKLEAALDYFGINPAGLTCLDVGASTGGFTDCLLQRGAAKVFAVDVGRGQLAWKFHGDPRVESHEKVNARELPVEFAAGVELVVMDVSFISITLILPRLRELLPNAPVLSLIKPQFEAGRQAVGSGGIVRDPEVWREVLIRIGANAASLGYRVEGPCQSPITGGDGNREFFYQFKPGAPRPPDPEKIARVIVP